MSQVETFAKEGNGKCLREFDGYPLGPEKLEFIDRLQKILDVNLSAKKLAFMKEIMPMAVNATEKVEMERDFLAKLMAKKEFSEEEKSKLAALHLKYKTDDIKDSKSALEELKMRINVIPLDLILTQAALESGWGATPVATKCNNLFGIHNSNGLSTCNSPSRKIAQFESVQTSIEYHILNLNRGDSYKAFREHRQKILDKKETLTGVALAPHLINYSTRKTAYTNELVKVDNSNKLSSSVVEAIKLTESYEWSPKDDGQ